MSDSGTRAQWFTLWMLSIFSVSCVASHVHVAAKLNDCLHHPITARFSRARRGVRDCEAFFSALYVPLARLTVVRVFPFERVHAS